MAGRLELEIANLAAHLDAAEIGLQNGADGRGQLRYGKDLDRHAAMLADGAISFPHFCVRNGAEVLLPEWLLGVFGYPWSI